MTSMQVSPRSLPPGGPKTNDVFEELKQNPTSDYSVSMVYITAMMATSEMPIKGDQISFDKICKKWNIIRKYAGVERKIILELVQLTHGGSLQFRILDIATGSGWRSVYLPTGPLSKSSNKKV